MTLVSATTAIGTCTTAAATVTCAMNDLSAGGSALVTLVVRPGVAGSLANTLECHCQRDRSERGGQQCDGDSDGKPGGGYQRRDRPSPNPVYAGTNLSYAVTISNQGPSTATGLTLSDVLPSGVTLVSATTANGTCTTAGATVTCAMNDLSAGELTHS